MHVIDREYYTPTKDDVIEFRNELYKIYEMLCKYFNDKRKNYVEDISTKFRDVLELVENLEEYEHTANASVDANAVVEANAVEATDTAIGAEGGYGEGDEGIAKEKIDTNDEDTGDKGLKKAKQLKELETEEPEEQDNKNKSVIAKNIEKKEPAPALTPAQALGLEHTNTKKEDENEADFRKLEESMNNTQNERANPLGAAQGMLEDAVQQQTKQLTALTDAANKQTKQLTALADTAKGQFTSIFDSVGSLKAQAAQATTPAGLFALASGQAQQPQQGERGQLQIPTYTRGLAGSVAKSK